MKSREGLEKELKRYEEEEIKMVCEKKSEELKKIGIFITNMDEIIENNQMRDEFLEYNVLTNDEYKAIDDYILSSVNLYSDVIGYKIECNFIIPEHPMGELTFCELKRKNSYRKERHEEVQKNLAKFKVETMKAYAMTMFERAMQEATKCGKKSVSFTYAEELKPIIIPVDEKDMLSHIFLKEVIPFLLLGDQCLHWELI